MCPKEAEEYEEFLSSGKDSGIVWGVQSTDPEKEQCTGSLPVT